MKRKTKLLIFLLSPILVLTLAFISLLLTVFLGLTTIEPVAMQPRYYQVVDSVCTEVASVKEADYIELSFKYQFTKNPSVKPWSRFIVDEDFVYKDISDLQVLLQDNRTGESHNLNPYLTNGITIGVLRDYLKHKVLGIGQCFTPYCDSMHALINDYRSSDIHFDSLERLIVKSDWRKQEQEHILKEISRLELIGVEKDYLCVGNPRQFVGDIEFFIREYNEGKINVGKIHLYEGPIFRVFLPDSLKQIEEPRIEIEVVWN